MSEMRHTEDHEWLRLEADGHGIVGITDYAQGELGDVVYVELPEIGKTVRQGEEMAVVESVKAAADVKAPATGTVVAVNSTLVDQPEKVNEDPLGEGWFVKIRLEDPAQVDALMDQASYDAYVEGLD